MNFRKKKLLMLTAFFVQCTYNQLVIDTIQFEISF